ncbi:MAG: putative hemolysin [Flavobacteriales bacterium]|jgi:putative hemolysin
MILELEPPPEPILLFNTLFTFLPLTLESLVSIVVTIILLVLSALISGSEVAYFSLDPIHINEIEQSTEKNDIRIIDLLSKPKRLLATILISNNFINVAIVLFSTFLMGNLIDMSGASALTQFLVQVIAVTFIILLIGEVIPKVYASSYALSLARFMAFPLTILSKILAPLSKVLAASSVFIDKKIKRKGNDFSANELDQALELTYNDTETSTEEKKILKGIVKFGNTDVTQIMTARVDVTALSFDTTYEELLLIIKSSGYSRIPVFKETFDHVAGILYIKDLLPYLNTTKENWQELIRAPFFVPENKKIDDLLKEFQEKKIHLAIVVDEYGGASGIVSLEDVIEEIVGDISDEFDDEDILFSKLDDNNFVFEGKIPLMDMYRILEIEGEEFEKEKGEAETLAGFLLEQSGKILKKNERLTFGNHMFTVEAADNRRIKRVKLTIQPKDEVIEQSKKRFFNFLGFFIVLIGFSSCEESYVPKQKSYFRIALPAHGYQKSALDCPYQFEHPTYSKALFSSQEKKNKCWPDLHFNKLNAKLYLTYQKIDNENHLTDLLNDSHKLTYDHAAKASGILSSRIDVAATNVHALMFLVKGDVASNVQFVATDSSKHFLRGSLYFYNKPNGDSLAPVVDFLTEDIKHLVETIQWVEL